MSDSNNSSTTIKKNGESSTVPTPTTVKPPANTK